MKWTWMAETVLQIQRNHAPFPIAGMERLGRSAWWHCLPAPGLGTGMFQCFLSRKNGDLKIWNRKDLQKCSAWGVQRLRRPLLHGCWRRHFSILLLMAQSSSWEVHSLQKGALKINKNHRIISIWKDNDHWQANLTILQRLWQLPGHQGFLACGLFLTVPDFWEDMPQFWPILNQSIYQCFQYDRTTKRYLLVTSSDCFTVTIRIHLIAACSYLQWISFSGTTMVIALRKQRSGICGPWLLKWTEKSLGVLKWKSCV